MCAQFLFVGMIAQWDEGGGGILLSNGTGSRVVKLRPIGRCVTTLVPVCWSFDFNWISLYIHTQLTVRIINSDLCEIQLMPDLLAHNYCTHWGLYVPWMHAHTHTHTHTHIPVCMHTFICGLLRPNNIVRSSEWLNHYSIMILKGHQRR